MACLAGGKRLRCPRRGDRDIRGTQGQLGRPGDRVRMLYGTLGAVAATACSREGVAWSQLGGMVHEVETVRREIISSSSVCVRARVRVCTCVCPRLRRQIRPWGCACLAHPQAPGKRAGQGLAPADGAPGITPLSRHQTPGRAGASSEDVRLGSDVSVQETVSDS